MAYMSTPKVEIGKYYQPKPMAYSRSGKYELAPHLTRPKPMALTVTRFMRLRRAFWAVVRAWWTRCAWKRANRSV